MCLEDIQGVDANADHDRYDFEVEGYTVLYNSCLGSLMSYCQ